VTEAGKRSWRERRPIARDRRKWKELVKTYVLDGTVDIITLYNPTQVLVVEPEDSASLTAKSFMGHDSESNLYFPL
jgi:hypothetical protein